MLDVPSERIQAYIREAETIALLDRLTAFRAGMRPDVLPLVKDELRRRGIGAEQIAAHENEINAAVIWESPGLARRCRYCERPATDLTWDWFRLWETIPIFPMRFYYCPQHAPADE
jgi:hypothetical protein